MTRIPQPNLYTLAIFFLVAHQTKFPPMPSFSIFVIMSKPLYLLLILLLSTAACVSAQTMQVKRNNYTHFSTTRKNIPNALNAYSSAAAKQHPEYGVMPPHSPCINCVELIDKRTIDSREYMDPEQPGHTFSQRSYFPLHYKKNAEDVWHSIDERLRPTNTPGVFTAPQQPNVTKSDINRKLTSITVQGYEFEFNKDVSMYFVDGTNAQSAVMHSDYSNYTAGDDGVYIKNIWQGIDMEQAFTLGEIKSTYVINEPLDIPVANGYLVIEDHFSLPAHYTIIEAAEGIHTTYGYEGNYEIKDALGKTVYKYNKATLYDAKVWGIAAGYELVNNGPDYTLRLLVPVTWLQMPENKYPLFIDPTVVSGNSKVGDYLSTTGGIPDNMAFTTIALGSCDHVLNNVLVPGRSEITNSYAELEYRLTYDSHCGTPALPTPFCTVSQVRQTIVSDQCNIPAVIVCNEALDSTYIGRCTSDPVAVPGAGPIQINTGVPNFLTCIPPTCADNHILSFTLKNQDSICGDVCGYLCAAGTMWAMTIEACRVDGYITQDKTQVCAGEPVVFTANPSCGVPPYHYLWSNDGGNTFDTIYNTPTYTYIPQTESPPGGFIVQCFIFDACGVENAADDGTVTVLSTPPADAGPDVSLCAGGAATLGGSPTTTGGASITWTGSSSTVQSWLSSNSFPNPVANVPAGTIDTFFYVLRTSNATCVRRDTVYVFSTTGPVANAGSDVNLCGGGTATLGGTPAASPGYSIEWAGYGHPDANSWLSNATASNPTLTIPAGTVDTVYYFIRVYNNQCGKYDTMAVFLPQAPLANAGPDINMCEGGLANLGGNPPALPGNIIVWTAADATAGTWLSSTNALNPQINVPVGTVGSYQYYLTVTDPNCSRIDTMLLTSYPNPVAVVDTSGPTLVCSNTYVTLSVAGNYSAYNWSNGATTQTTQVSQTSNYYVVVKDVNSCTDTSNIITVTSIPAPVITVYPDTAINFGDDVVLYTDLNLSALDSFIWYPNLDISCTDCPNPIATPVSDTYYGINVYANGCPATDSALIKIILKNNFYIPNAFTPNGDGNNDDFYILAQRGVEVLEFQVFNRIGEKVHEALYAWDGTYKGKPAPAGTYVYYLKLALFGEQQSISRKGSVVLIR